MCDENPTWPTFPDERQSSRKSDVPNPLTLPVRNCQNGADKCQYNQSEIF